MDCQQQTTTPSRPLVEWLAGMIPDPVVRLRFLNAAAGAPLSPVRQALPKWRIEVRTLLVPGLVATMLATFFLVRAVAHVEPPRAPARRLEPPAAQAHGLADVWLVENDGNSEIYSNGLRVDNHFAVSNHPRSYLAFPANRHTETGGEWGVKPVGIVFHTTESRQLPFEASENGALKKMGESLLEYVRRKRAYHFVIDRFGRVYRLVAESDAANHAGYSIWADDAKLYLNLNESFLGVSFEADTQPGQVRASVSPGQVRAAATLTEMLRSRYSIRAENCVTHAQVSVNPSNMRVGYHTDWASSFPFEQLGLPDNYARALPALFVFGFEYDPTFLDWAGTRLYAGVELAEQNLKEGAAESGLAPAAYRKVLQKRYLKRLAAVRGRHSGDEEGSE